MSVSRELVQWGMVYLHNRYYSAIKGMGNTFFVLIWSRSQGYEMRKQDEKKNVYYATIFILLFLC